MFKLQLCIKLANSNVIEIKRLEIRPIYLNQCEEIRQNDVLSKMKLSTFPNSLKENKEVFDLIFFKKSIQAALYLIKSKKRKLIRNK